MEASKLADLVVVLYANDERIKAILDYYATRERDPRNSRTILKNIRDGLRNRFGIDALQNAFGELETLGCGKFHKGRPRKNGSFEWLISPRELAQSIVKDGNGSEPKRAGTAPENSILESFPFPVRPGITLPQPIRSDMTAAEIYNLAEFIKVIAASRANAAPQQK
jgi:hypothetical protein